MIRELDPKSYKGRLREPWICLAMMKDDQRGFGSISGMFDKYFRYLKKQELFPLFQGKIWNKVTGSRVPIES